MAVLLASLGLMSSGCSSGDGNRSGEVGPSYVHGSFEGALAKQLIEVFSPRTWSGQTDGPVLVSADRVFTLSDVERAALRKVLADGHAVVVSEVTQQHIERIHQLGRTLPAISLDASAADSAALYVLAQPRGLLRVLVVKSVPEWLEKAEVDAHKATYARRTAEWFLEQRALHRASGAALTSSSGLESAEPSILSETTFPFKVTQLASMQAFYSNACGARQTCADLVTVRLFAWAVHNTLPLRDQDTDYVIARLEGDFNTDGCKLAIGKNDRFAGYWLRQANLNADLADVTIGGYRLPDGASMYGYEPHALNPDQTREKGVTFNIGGSGTITGGASAKGPSLSGSLAFGAGVSYTNTSRMTLPAVATIPKIGTVANPTKVTWTFDSWNHVRDNIKPANHACGGPGLDVSSTALPPIIYGATFHGEGEWVWSLTRKVRDALPIEEQGYIYLPVDINASALRGWAMFPALGGYYCSDKASLAPRGFNLGNDCHVDIVGETLVDPAPGAPSYTALGGPTSHSNGLGFDPGCGTAVRFGTIPLGDPTNPEMDGTNVGPPFDFGTVRVNIPLPPDPRRMTLERIEPTSGPTGQPIKLYGRNLHTALSVSIGGYAPYSQSIEWPTEPDGEPTLTVTAPLRVAPKENTAAVTVSNGVVTSPPVGAEVLLFTYTDGP